MTIERIKDFEEIVLPFFTNYLLKENYENLGKSDAEEFEKDFNEILELAAKALEHCENAISRQAALDIYDDYNVAVENGELEAYRKHRKRLLKLPSVQSKPKTGHWKYFNYNWLCSECNETPKTMGYVGTADFMKEHFKFCNHCGARMIDDPDINDGKLSEISADSESEEYGLTDADTDKYAVQVQNGEGYYNSDGRYVSYDLD